MHLFFPPQTLNGKAIQKGHSTNPRHVRTDSCAIATVWQAARLLGLPCTKGKKNGFHGNIGFVVLAFEAGIRQRQISVCEVIDLYLTGGWLCVGGGRRVQNPPDVNVFFSFSPWGTLQHVRHAPSA